MPLDTTYPPYICCKCGAKTEIWSYWPSIWTLNIDGKPFVWGRPFKASSNLKGITRIFDGYLDPNVCARCVAKVRFAALGELGKRRIRGYLASQYLE